MEAALNGIVNFLKPPGMSSSDAVAWIRRVLGVKKAGHCGALDPDACGVLPVCVGAATKAAGRLLESDKKYRVEAVAGLLTDTLDTSGTILDAGPRDLPERARFEAALGAFTGRVDQTPPMFSAVKIGGQRLYKLARKGVEIERAPRPIEIYSLDIVYYNGGRVIFDVACSKGTYVRALCRDLGERLGIYLCMSYLLRTESAGMRVADSISADELETRARAGTVEEILIRTESLNIFGVL